MGAQIHKLNNSNFSNRMKRTPTDLENLSGYLFAFCVSNFCLYGSPRTSTPTTMSHLKVGILLAFPLGKGDRLRWMRLFKIIQWLHISCAIYLIRQSQPDTFPKGKAFEIFILKHQDLVETRCYTYKSSIFLTDKIFTNFFVDSTTNRRVRERNLGITATSFAKKRQNTQIYKNVFYRSNFIHKNFDNFAKKLLTMHFLFDRMKVNNNVFFLSAGESTF